MGRWPIIISSMLRTAAFAVQKKKKKIGREKIDLKGQYILRILKFRFHLFGSVSAFFRHK